MYMPCASLFTPNFAEFQNVDLSMMRYSLSWSMHLVNIVMMKMMMMEMTILMREMTSKKIGKVTGWVCLSADFKN